jgi:putative endonuclease
MKQPCVYIMANRRNGTVYVGVTSDLITRAYEHREGLAPGFTRRYGCKTLVWYELHGSMTAAIERETAQGRKSKKEVSFDRGAQSGVEGFVRDPDLNSHSVIASNPETRKEVWIASSLRSSR